MDDFTINVRQLGQYPQAPVAGPLDAVLIQQGGLGGPYAYINAPDLVATALESVPLTLNLKAGEGVLWIGGFETAGLSFADPTDNPTGFAFSHQLFVPALEADAVLINGAPAATQAFVTAAIGERVTSFNGRTGAVQLQIEDVLRAGGAPQINPHFAGVCTAPTIWNARDAGDTIATTGFVQAALCAFYADSKAIGAIVTSFNGRGGDVTLTAADITIGATQQGRFAQANTPPLGDASRRIANTLFVDNALAVARQELGNEFNAIAAALDATFAPLDSPQFSGIPTAPTAAQTVNSGQLATTAFVHNAVTASTTGVSSFNSRTGDVSLTTSDVVLAGAALNNSPLLTGNPRAPTATPGDSSVSIATTAFVMAAVAGVSVGVTSFNTRTGDVVLATADVTAVGGALLASPAFSGTPTAPTALPSVSTTQIATTAYVTAAIAALPALVTSFNGRTGAITFQGSDISAAGGALLASPAFTGNPTSTTATVGTSNTQIATTAFVAAAVAGGTAGVASFNTRTGAVTLAAGDITGAGGALLAGPAFTGVPSAPTAAPGVNTTQLATTAFVTAALAAAPGGVSSFNGRTGAITLQASDVSAVGGALLSNPVFTGDPRAPTPAPGDNDTSIATTAFVTAALAGSGGVSSFNGRAGVVTLSAADITGAGGALLAQAVAKAGDTMTGNLSLASANPSIFMNKSAAGQGSAVVGQLNNNFRWVLYLGDTASESGSNAGSNFVVNRYSDAGTIVDTPLQISRATGIVSFSQPINAPGGHGPLAIQVFTTSGTYTPTAGMVKCIVECVGGGGAGGGVPGNVSNWVIGSGGGSGGYSKKLLTAAGVGASQAVTIGAGGAGTTGIGPPGGDTSFGTLCIAKGATSPANNLAPGPGGPATGAVGDIIAAGNAGNGGTNIGGSSGAGVAAGSGAGSFLGGGAAGKYWATSGAGSNAGNYGAGGGGASANNVATSFVGGNGSAGVCIVTEF